jgi:hypothetical protein
VYHRFRRWHDVVFVVGDLSEAKQLKPHELYYLSIVSAVFILLGSKLPEALATEIVLIGCPEGLVVVSDKRQHLDPPQHGHAFDDHAMKVQIVRPFLIVQTGKLFELYLDKSNKHGAKIIHKYFGHSFWKEAAAAAEYKNDSISEPDVSRKLTEQVCKVYQQKADRLERPWKLRSNDYVCSVAFIKASPNREKIEGTQVFLGARDHEDGKHEIFAKDISDFTFGKSDVFCRLLGLSARSTQIVSGVNALPDSMAKAVEWAENEILTRSLKSPMVGSTVDEYLVRFDGNISRLAANKNLRK